MTREQVRQYLRINNYTLVYVYARVVEESKHEGWRKMQIMIRDHDFHYTRHK